MLRASIGGFGTFETPIKNLGQINLSIHKESRKLVVFIGEARGLKIKSDKKNKFETYIKAYIIPDSEKLTKVKSKSIKGSRNPNYNENFSYNIGPFEKHKELNISVWVTGFKHTQLGNMSFSLEEITLLASQGNVISGWYYLLAPGSTDAKNIPVDPVAFIKKSPSSEFSNQESSKEDINPPLSRSEDVKVETRTYILKKRKGGVFGIGVTGQAPPIVNYIEAGSPADDAGIRVGDQIIKLMESDTAKSNTTYINSILKACPHQLKITIQRGGSISPRKSLYQSTATSASLPPTDAASSAVTGLLSDKTVSNLPHGDSENEISSLLANFDDFLADIPLTSQDPTNTTTTEEIPSTISSSPTMPFKLSSLITEPLSEFDRQEALISIAKLELRTMEVQLLGDKVYSLPLKSSLLTRYDHDTIFKPNEGFLAILQNIRKAFEKRVNNFSANPPGYIGYVSSVGDIYSQEIDLIVDFYSRRKNTKNSSFKHLLKCRERIDFNNFLEKTRNNISLSIEDFLEHPGVYRLELIERLRAVLTATPTIHSDYSLLRDVLDSLEILKVKQHSISGPTTPESLVTMHEMMKLISFTNNSIEIDLTDTPNRKLIAEIKLEMVERRTQEVYILLFTDVLLICRKRFNKFISDHVPFYLTSLMIHDFNCVDIRDFQLVLVGPQGKVSETKQFRAKSEQNKDKWKKIIGERATGTQALKVSVQSKRSYAGKFSDEKEPWDVWEKEVQERKVSVPTGFINKVDKSFASNLLSKDKGKLETKLTNVSVRNTKTPSPTKTLAELLAEEEVTPERVEKWTINLGELLNDQIGVECLRSFMSEGFCQENLQFYLDCKNFYSMPQSELLARSEYIYKTYVKETSRAQVNLDDVIRDEIEKKMIFPTRYIFTSAQRSVYTLIETDIYPRFLKSSILKQFQLSAI